jgi:tripartite-type tricarboxylate transporter receptor subunit TctC
MQEQGFPEFETMNWYGISGPAKLPAALARRINEDVNKVLAMPDVDEKFDTFGVEDGGGSVERYGEFVRVELAKWAKVAKDAKVSIDA